MSSNNPEAIERREAISRIIATTAGIEVAVFLRHLISPERVLAVGRTWIDDEWGPMAQGIPSLRDGHILAVFHGTGQIGEIHDRWAPEVVGEHTNLQEELAERAYYYLTYYPHLRSSLGYCGAFVNAVILGENPQTKLQKQAAAMKHVGDYQVPLSRDEAIDYLKSGQMVGSYLAEEVGIWVRLASAYDPRTRRILVSTYGVGSGDKWAPIDMAKDFQGNGEGFYIPVHPGAPALDDFIAVRLEERRDELEWLRRPNIFQNAREEVFNLLLQ